MTPRRILDGAQMRAVDTRTIETLGIPARVLMENAGREVAAVVAARLGTLPGRRVAVVCGTGSNGGDGFVVARLLHERGADVRVILLGTADDVRGPARPNLEAVLGLHVPFASVTTGTAWEAERPWLGRAHAIVDAILGTGVSRALTGLHARVVDDVSAAAHATVIAVDLPSGMASGTAELIGPTIRADVTVALAALKLPLVLPPACLRAGEIVVADIGIPTAFVDAVEGARVFLTTRQAAAALLPRRQVDAHKGDRGRVLIAAGSRGKTGAAALSAWGALRAGAGLVTVATPASAQPIVAALGAELMTRALPESAEGTVAPGAAELLLGERADAMAIGPGLGTGDGVATVVRDLLAQAACPVVVDADGLNACAAHPERLAGRDERPVVITPHPGEMARLVGRSVAEVQARRLDVAREFATSHRVHVVLKGFRTLVATPSGEVFVNPTGSPGMATGGTGDVLTGVVAACLAQGLTPEAACRLAVYVHGAAGERASAAMGEAGMVAGDLARELGPALAALEVVRERAGGA